jgi:hypothetical protein
LMVIQNGHPYFFAHRILRVVDILRVAKIYLKFKIFAKNSTNAYGVEFAVY